MRPSPFIAGPQFVQCWLGLHDAAQQLAAYAALAPEPFTGRIEQFAIRYPNLPQPRRRIVFNAVEELELLLKNAVASLERVRARGGDTVAPAVSLWIEFHSARSYIFDIAAHPEC